MNRARSFGVGFEKGWGTSLLNNNFPNSENVNPRIRQKLNLTFRDIFIPHLYLLEQARITEIAKNKQVGLFHDCHVLEFQAVRRGSLLHQRILRSTKSLQGATELRAQGQNQISSRRLLFRLQQTHENLLWQQWLNALPNNIGKSEWSFFP